MKISMEDGIRSYFDQEKYPQIDEEIKLKLKSEVSKNKKSSFKWNFGFKWACASLCMLCLAVLSIALPIVYGGGPQDIKFYCDVNTNRVALDRAKTTEYILLYNPEYKFLLNEDLFEYDRAFTFHTKDTNNVVGYELQFISLINDKYSMLTLIIPIHKNYSVAQENAIKTNSEKFTYSKYTVYKKIIGGSVAASEASMSALFEYSNYSIQLTIDRIDEELFNIFLI